MEHAQPQNIISIKEFRSRKRRKQRQHVYLYKRGDIYWVHYTFIGKRYRASLDTMNIHVAEAKQATLEYKIRMQLFSAPTDITVSEFENEYLAFKGKRNSRHTMEVEGPCVKSFFKTLHIIVFYGLSLNCVCPLE